MIDEKGLTGKSKDVKYWGKFIEPLAEDFKTKKDKNVGFVSAKEIIKLNCNNATYKRIPENMEESLNKLFLSRDVLDKKINILKLDYKRFWDEGIVLSPSEFENWINQIVY